VAFSYQPLNSQCDIKFEGFGEAMALRHSEKFS